MVRFIFLSLLFFALSACSSNYHNSLSRAGDDCNAPLGWESVAAEAEGRVLFFGEIHGTNEIPPAFSKYVCAVSSGGGGTLVVLEIGEQHQRAIDLASDRTVNDVRSFLGEEMTDHWSLDDGRGSVANLTMVADIIQLRKAGFNIDILAAQALAGMPEFKSADEAAEWFQSVSPSELQQLGESGFAGKVLSIANQYDRVIVLVGNIHARQTPPAVFAEVQTAAMLIPDSLSLLVVTAGGTSWNMRNDVAGIHEIPPNEFAFGLDESTRLRMSLSEDLAPAFDGYIYVGRVSASPPAIPK